LDQHVEAPPLQPAHHGGGTVLVVEDNEEIRAVVVKQLSALGFNVMEADTAERALEVVEQRRPIDLLFTDVVLPGRMDGCMLARKVMSQTPAPKILLTSGFPGTSLSGVAELGGGVRLLSKPYRQDELFRVLREVMDGHRAPAPQ